MHLDATGVHSKDPIDQGNPVLSVELAAHAHPCLRIALHPRELHAAAVQSVTASCLRGGACVAEPPALLGHQVKTSYTYKLNFYTYQL